MSASAQWIFSLAQALEARSGPNVVNLLNPKIQMKRGEKEKIDHDSNPGDFMQAKRYLLDRGVADQQGEWEAFVQWSTHFLRHSKCLDQVGSWDPTPNAIEVFASY